MKKTISILILFSLCISFVVPVTSLSPPQNQLETQKDYVDIKVPQGEITFYTIPDDKTFVRLDIMNWKCHFKTEPKPEVVFETYSSGENSSGTTAEDMVYEYEYDYEILKKGYTDVLRIHVPETCFKSGKRFDTKQMTVRIYFESKSEQTGFTTSYDPQPANYLIITNESLWQTFNDEFKDWKIANDPKISGIVIRNVSNILASTSVVWVNGSRGDASNATAGNSWIPDGKEITSSWWLFNDTQAQIRNYIRFVYDTVGIRYVLLGGNKDVVPPRQAATRASGDGCGSYDNDMSHASDMYYECLHYSMNNNTNSYFMENECCGNVFDEVDWGFDLYVGRALVNNVSTLNNWIGKTKNYTLGNNNGNYLSNQICAAKDSGNSITDDTWLDLGGIYTASIYRQFYPISNITWVNGQNISQAQWDIMDDYVNGVVGGWDGINMILCAGHGAFHSGRLWDQYHPWICNNSALPNFVYAESCMVGGFGTTTVTCAEDWMKYDSCIFAGILNSAYGWFGASTDFMVDFLEEMFNQTLGNQTLQFSLAHQTARERQGHTYADGVWAMIYKETNFFGDPALEYQWYIEEAEGPQFISIDGGLNMTNVYSSTPTFNWTRITNASQYQLQISNNSIFTDLVLNLSDISEVSYPTYYSQNTTRVSFTLPPSCALPYLSKLYYCRVRAHMEV